MKYAATTVIGALMFVGGCAHQHTPTVSTIESLEAKPAFSLVSAEPAQNHSAQWSQVIAELLVAYEQTRTPAHNSSTQLPQLVAGDWLAVRCAMAGGYWDAPMNDNMHDPMKNDAPAYAEAPESWYPLD
ncbi:MAG: hypothetical protein ACX94C_05735 [Phycisphaerales bacterium]